MNDSIDGDGDGDLFAQSPKGEVKNFWENIGTATNPQFAASTSTYPYGVPSFRMIMTFYDVDGDGDLDLIAPGEMKHGIKYYRNEGTATNPSYKDKTTDGSINPFGVMVVDTFVPYKGEWTPHNTQMVDLDGDGMDDFIMMADNGQNGKCLKFFKANKCVRRPLGFDMPCSVTGSPGAAGTDSCKCASFLYGGPFCQSCAVGTRLNRAEGGSANGLTTVFTQTCEGCAPGFWGDNLDRIAPCSPCEAGKFGEELSSPKEGPYCSSGETPTPVVTATASYLSCGSSTATDNLAKVGCNSCPAGWKQENKGRQFCLPCVRK